MLVSEKLRYLGVRSAALFRLTNRARNGIQVLMLSSVSGTSPTVSRVSLGPRTGTTR